MNFVGFESAAPMAEETADPRRNIPRSVIYSVLILGIVYLLASFASVFGWGIGDLAKFATNAAPFNVMANRVLGIGTLLVFLAATNSSFGCSLATINQGTRVLMSMGRNGLLPRSVGAVHPKYRTPHVSAAVLGVLAFAIAVAAGLVWGTVTGFAVLAATLTDGAILIYILGNIGLPVYYRRHVPGSFNWVTHVLLPALAVLLLGYVFYRTFWPIPAYPLNLPGYITVGWIVVGFLLTIYARRTRPEALTAVLAEEIG